MEHLDVFRRNYLVAGLPEAVADEIAQLADFRVLLSREFLVREHERGTDLFVVLEGTLHVLATDGTKLGEIGPGSLVGEVALVDDGPRSADVVAVGMVKLACLPGGKLRRWMWDHKEIGFVMLANLCRVLSMRLRGANDQVEELSGKQDPWNLAY